MNVSGQPADYQRAVYEELLETAADFYQYDWHALPVTPRTNVLLVGSTGTGKTYLCRRLAAELEIPLLDLEYGTWIVTGARASGGVHTLRHVYGFIEAHERGVIVFDEIDKLGGSESLSDWTRSVHMEVFSLLDRRVFPAVVDRDSSDDEGPVLTLTAQQLEHRLTRGYMIVAGGAFQHLWRKQCTAGFAAGESAVASLPTYKELVETVRPEVLNRFRARVLFMPPLSRADYLRLVEETLVRLPEEFGPIIREAATTTVDEAVSMQKGYRFVEELVASAIRSLRVPQGPRTSSPHPELHVDGKRAQAAEQPSC